MMWHPLVTSLNAPPRYYGFSQHSFSENKKNLQFRKISQIMNFTNKFNLILNGRKWIQWFFRPWSSAKRAARVVSCRDLKIYFCPLSAFLNFGGRGVSLFAPVCVFWFEKVTTYYMLCLLLLCFIFFAYS